MLNMINIGVRSWETDKTKERIDQCSQSRTSLAPIGLYCQDHRLHELQVACIGIQICKSEVLKFKSSSFSS